MLSDTLELLKFINQHDMVTVAQVGAWFGYKKGSYTAITERLNRLAWPPEKELPPREDKRRSKEIAKRILEARWIPHPTSLRGANLIYFLGRQGIKDLEEAGFKAKRTSFDDGTAISEHNWHNINANWPHIAAHDWVKRTSGVRIARAETAFDMSRNKALRAMCEKLGIGGRGRIMDGLQAFAFADPNKDDKQYLLEVETGSQEPAEVRRKVEGLVKFEQYFEAVFGNSLFNGYLFFATATHGIKDGNPRYKDPDEHRKMLLTAIATQLGKMDMRNRAPLFRVTSELPNSPHLFDRPVWWFPDDYSGPYRLFVDKL